MTNYQKPDYYLYQDKGHWFITDEAMTKKITLSAQGFTDDILPKTQFLPQWAEPTDKTERILAWRVNEFGNQVVRNYWKTIDHDARKHTNTGCKPIGGGKCLVRVACQLEWSPKFERWILSEMADKALASDLASAGID